MICIIYSYCTFCRNILFWNEVQLVVLSSLDQKTAINLLFFGDFGGGKTATLVEGALQCALRGGTTYFICATVECPILYRKT